MMGWQGGIALAETEVWRNSLEVDYGSQSHASARHHSVLYRVHSVGWRIRRGRQSDVYSNRPCGLGRFVRPLPEVQTLGTARRQIKRRSRRSVQSESW